MAVEDDATREAPADAPAPTTELGPSAAPAEALAYSAGTDGVPVADYQSPRSWTWTRVLVLIVVILVAAGGAAAAILRLGQRTAPPPPPVEAAPAAVPGPVGGVYRFDRYGAQTVARFPDGSIEPPLPQNQRTFTWWYAIRSECAELVCTAEAVQLDDELHDHAISPRVMTLRLVNGQWRTDPPVVSHQACNGGESGVDTWEMAYTLTALPDRTMTGQQVDTITTDECGSAGLVFTSPVGVTRYGEVPSTVSWDAQSAQ